MDLLGYMIIMLKTNLYIGSEVYLAGIGHLIGNIKKDNLSNIKIINGDVRCFLEEVKQPLFDEIVIICPDPWPKLKHHKRRMINDEFLKLIYPTIKANGNLYISTDWENYAESINEVLKKSKIFVNKNLVLGKVIRCSDNLCSLSDDYNVEVMI